MRPLRANQELSVIRSVVLFESDRFRHRPPPRDFKAAGSCGQKAFAESVAFWFDGLQPEQSCAMPAHNRVALHWLRWILTSLLLSVTAASAQNRVLELDGKNGFVELPANAFTNLNEVTVEGWVKWESFG